VALDQRDADARAAQQARGRASGEARADDGDVDVQLRRGHGGCLSPRIGLWAMIAMSPAASIVHPPKSFGPATADPSALLERERELDVLAQLVAATVAGRGAAAFVTGPAGIGKTSLLRAAADLASAAGMEVLSARGGEMEQEFAHGIVRQLFEPAVRALEPTARARMLCGAAAATAPIVDPTSALPPGPAAAPFTVLHGLYWLCANLAARRPVLLAVDDAHWCDESSLRFLAYLQRRLEGSASSSSAPRAPRPRP
jgi:hypothetical protein